MTDISAILILLAGIVVAGCSILAWWGIYLDKRYARIRAASVLSWEKQKERDREALIRYYRGES